MHITEIFEQEIDRPIEGVIKADDEEKLALEVKEYVITKEVHGRLQKFLDAYNNYEGANGVWISGFFGSGKSHLLKMVALLLENRPLDGVSVLESFLNKTKSDVILQADIKKAVSIPSKSILFNIDQKADVISKTEVDALLSVFVKVFDEACGYYGKQSYIAQFERELDSDELFGKFKEEFLKLEPKGWDWGRMRAKRVSSKIDDAYFNATGSKVNGILDKYRSDYKLSIEDFADQVAAYIDTKEKNFRLNFFVDEVGQYIANNTKLMTNLQTVAESLATKCRGQAWVIVTAQEDMNSVIGDMTKQQGNDFSKIQARFSNRMKLTSADVEEVIRKRLLMKKENGIDLLSKIYHEQVNNFKTLFDFSDGSQQFKNFEDRDHFIHSYPFIPYHFVLFQSSIQSLSSHNIFEGEHSSTGERSMLGVFQEVAVHLKSHEIGQLATFDLMFEGIRTALKSKSYTSINVAEKHIDNKLAVKVLKALFLVKYIKEFKPTIRNLSVLMLENFDQNQMQLRKDIEEALHVLENSNYIQRSGDLYEYLTDEEQDVEKEIKNTDIETSSVLEELNKIVYTYIIKGNKIRFTDNNQDYGFSKKIDGKLFSREQELAIDVITPLNDNISKESTLRMQNMGRDELLIIMPEDDRLVKDILMYKKTEKYYRQNISITQNSTIQRVLTEKNLQNNERYADIRSNIEVLISKAKLFVGESEVEITSEDPAQRINKAFQSLILRAYPNLVMLRGISYSEKDIVQCLQRSKDGLFSNDVASLADSEQEILGYIQSNKRGGVRTTLKSIVERFETKPYGWYFAAILCNVSHLIGRGKIELKDDSNVIEGKDLERALLNTSSHPNIVIEPQIDFTTTQVRNLKEVYEDFFDSPSKQGEAKELALESANMFKEKLIELEKISSQKSNFPFLVSLDEIISELKDISSKPYSWYLMELDKYEDKLYKYKKDTIVPIISFMSNDSLKRIYLDAKEFLETQSANFSYIDTTEVRDIEETLLDKECYKNNKLSTLKQQLESLESKINKAIEEELNQASVKINTLKNRLEAMEQFTKIDVYKQDLLLKKFDTFINSIQSQKLIAVIRDNIRRFEDSEYSNILMSLDSYSIKPTIQKDFEEETSTPEEKPQVKYVNSKSINISYTKAWLESEHDVDSYLESMKEALIKEINEGKRVQV